MRAIPLLGCASTVTERRDTVTDQRDRTIGAMRSAALRARVKPATARAFDAWIAGATAEQAEAWAKRHATPAAVPDNELPEPLRGGALEVF